MEVVWETFKLQPREIGKIRKPIKELCNFPKTAIEKVESFTRDVENTKKELANKENTLSSLSGFLEKCGETSIKDAA